ncbi:zinc-binding dehydrogenase [bacterium]|nr:zinc-binding dehydrogenase [bacterium]
MRVAMLEEHGRPLRLTTVARPIDPGPAEVLVRIRASGVNPLDLKIQHGAAPHARHPAPAVLGLDMAGTIEAIGADVAGFQIGDDVYGLVGGVGGIQGTLAEFALVDAALLGPKPESLSYREAAVLPLVVITAWEGLVDRMQIRRGHKLLVLGGGGGVGQAAIQIGRQFGAEVFATGSQDSRHSIESAGAAFIDKREPVADYVSRLTQGEGFDLVYDTAGGSSLDTAFAAVRTFGHVASALGWGTHALAPLSFKGASYSGVFALMPLLSGKGRSRHGEILRDASALVDAGALRPFLSPDRFTLETTAAAYLAASERKSRGKIAVDIG